MAEAADPLILTLLIDAPTQLWADELRQRYFPPERNFIPAHVTLFHALPGDQLASICKTLDDQTMTACDVSVGPARLLGHGVALAVDAPEIARLRNHLAGVWRSWLTRQDAQGWRPHVTIQNKVPVAEARHLHHLLQALPTRGARAEGLQLWSYKNPTWDARRRFVFGHRLISAR